MVIWDFNGEQEDEIHKETLTKLEKYKLEIDDKIQDEIQQYENKMEK